MGVADPVGFAVCLEIVCGINCERGLHAYTTRTKHSRAHAAHKRIRRHGDVQRVRTCVPDGPSTVTSRLVAAVAGCGFDITTADTDGEIPTTLASSTVVAADNGGEIPTTFASCTVVGAVNGGEIPTTLASCTVVGAVNGGEIPTTLASCTVVGAVNGGEIPTTFASCTVVGAVNGGEIPTTFASCIVVAADNGGEISTTFSSCTVKSEAASMPVKDFVLFVVVAPQGTVATLSISGQHKTLINCCFVFIE